MNTKRIAMAVIPLLLAFFMAILDTGIVNVVLPKMTAHYGASVQSISWVVNGYSLSFAVFLLTASRLADQFGRKKAFVAGLLLFTVSSLLCGLSDTVGLLIMFRVLQGIGAAFIVPLVVPLLLALFPPEKRAMLVGITGALAGLAAASGPALGGVLSDRLDWQWVFYINIPFGIAAVALAAYALRESVDPTAGRRLDWGGMLTASAFALTLTLALMQANDKGWTSAYILTLFAVAAVSLYLFVRIETNVREPMLPLSLFRIGKFTAGNAGLFLLGVGMTGPTFVLAFFLTEVVGMTELRTGLIISVLAVASMICSVFAAKGVEKLGARPFSVTGMLLLGLGTYLLAGLDGDSATWAYVWRLVIAGMGTGLTIAPLTAATLMLAPEDKATIAMGLGTMSRTLGTVFGIAVLVALLSHTTRTGMELGKEEAIRLVAESSLPADAKAAWAESLGGAGSSGGIREARGAMAAKLAAEMERLEKKATEAAPLAEKERVKASFEKQKREMEPLMTQVRKTFDDRLSGAFGLVFRWSSLALLLGAVFAFLNGERTSRRIVGGKEAAAQTAKQARG
ncbi:MFS transporter [Paenibacillus flagellatus]|uniref:MFS transporter n=1 Tax=Paenibacillus flagellatus TaxID=2211139 RepID=A0A2V5KNH1_9BACL|nr:MFS transporter [Paenibacillus flagellatus]PYI52637.1 MFS transporter [Paenibacillus flagellatus]